MPRQKKKNFGEKPSFEKNDLAFTTTTPVPVAVEPRKSAPAQCVPTGRVIAGLGAGAKRDYENRTSLVAAGVDDGQRDGTMGSFARRLVKQ